MQTKAAIKAYHLAERESVAEGDDPHQLIGVLFDELIRRIEIFRAIVLDPSNQNLEKRGENFSKAISILHALQLSLDFDGGGEIAGNLFKLYEYSRRQLLECLNSGAVEGLDVALSSLKEIRLAWSAIRPADGTPS